MSNLRLDYFLSLGLKLVEGDTYSCETHECIKITGHLVRALNGPDDNYNNQRFITSFAPRKNTGEQPCGDDVPIETVTRNGSAGNNNTEPYQWELTMCDSDIKSWKPDLQELIKMQDKHDNKQDTKTDFDAVVAFGNNEISGNVKSFRFNDCGLGACYYIATKEDGFVCTIEEFNQCVKDMSRTNTSYDTFQRYLDSNTPLEAVKPKMKVEYVQVDKNGDNGAYWECARDYAQCEGNVFHYSRGDDFITCKDNDQLLSFYKQGILYRKVETEITWQDELDTFLCKSDVTAYSICDSRVKMTGWLRDEEFIEMCHLVSSMNK